VRAAYLDGDRPEEGRKTTLDEITPRARQSCRLFEQLRAEIQVAHVELRLFRVTAER
jgi:hypothetical protein